MNMYEASYRHCRCANFLEQKQNPEYAEAGYLYGLAAECAVKFIATNIPQFRRDEIFYAHFPDLKNSVLNYAEGRGTDKLAQILDGSHGYMGGWYIGMRYENNRSVHISRVSAWREDAMAVIKLMDQI